MWLRCHFSMHTSSQGTKAREQKTDPNSSSQLEVDQEQENRERNRENVVPSAWSRGLDTTCLLLIPLCARSLPRLRRRHRIRLSPERLSD